MTEEKNPGFFQIEDDWFGCIVGLGILLVIIIAV